MKAETCNHAESHRSIGSIRDDQTSSSSSNSQIMTIPPVIGRSMDVDEVVDLMPIGALDGKLEVKFDANKDFHLCILRQQTCIRP